jgi:hypothetical protein
MTAGKKKREHEGERKKERERKRARKKKTKGSHIILNHSTWVNTNMQDFMHLLDGTNKPDFTAPFVLSLQKAKVHNKS